MTSCFSVAMLGLFLPAVIVVYRIAPRRARWAVLLGGSYLVFWSISGRLIVFLLASTVSVYAIGLRLQALLDAQRAALRMPGACRASIKRSFRRRMRAWLAAGMLFNFGLLIAVKYLAFLSSLIFGASIEGPGLLPRIGIPIGISFYTMQAASYLFDVYRRTTGADRNLARLALYMSFFPAITEGPICRYADTAEQLWAGSDITGEHLFRGWVRILYGLAKRMIVANRLNAFVKPVFDHYQAYDGGLIALAGMLYTFQLYCDFSGTMDFVVGAGQIFGVRMPENFRQPFFSKTASEFWQRWHITLGTWFRDYLFYPISLSRPVKRITKVARARLGTRFGPIAASSIALLCVWTGNGLWHGAGTQYLLFGMYYFVLILAGAIIDPFAQRVCERVGIDRDAPAYRRLRVARTVLIVCAGEILFRAASARDGLAMLGRLLTRFTLASFADGSAFAIGLDMTDFFAAAGALAAIIALSAARERGAHLMDTVWSGRAPLRWAVVCVLITATVIFGAYGVGYIPVDPMYAQF